MPRKYRLDKLEIPDLTAFSNKVRRQVMGKGARILALRVREIVPDSGNQHKGKLKKSIRYGTKKAGFQGYVKAKAPHAHLVHDGAKAHIIPAPKDPEKLRQAWMWYPGGRPIQHPGIQHPNPFLIKAGEDSVEEVNRALKEAADTATAEIAEGT